jgi:hypothetical protein
MRTDKSVSRFQWDENIEERLIEISMERVPSQNSSVGFGSVSGLTNVTDRSLDLNV